MIYRWNANSGRLNEEILLNYWIKDPEINSGWRVGKFYLRISRHVMLALNERAHIELNYKWSCWIQQRNVIRNCAARGHAEFISASYCESFGIIHALLRCRTLLKELSMPKLIPYMKDPVINSGWCVGKFYLRISRQVMLDLNERAHIELNNKWSC